MNKHISPNQVLLIGIATVLLLLVAGSFYLLQDPEAPLPFALQPPINTILPISASSTSTPAPSTTSLPTRQTSYTPFASLEPLTPSAGEISGTPGTPGTPGVPGTPGNPITSGTPGTPGAPGTPGNPVTSGTPGNPVTSGTPGATVTRNPLTPTTTASTTTPQPTSIGTQTPTHTPGGPTQVPSATSTLIAGEHLVTGRIVLNSTPLASVIVRFADDDPPRQTTTNAGGHYSFTTLAPGTNFYLQFSRTDNPQVTPAAEVASLAWIEGNLPTGIDIITLPDMEISLRLEGMIFELETPINGAAYSAAAISPNNPLQFNWTLYNQGESYFVELGATGNAEPVWISDATTSTSLMWNGTLDDGSHISEGTYWWRVGVTNTLEGYRFFVYTPQNNILFNP